MIDPALLETVSVPLALEDAVPVVLSAAAMAVLARAFVRPKLGDRAGHVALAGAALIGAGGLTKVVWKIAAAGFERDLTGLDDLLFPLLAVGFHALTTLVMAARRMVRSQVRRTLIGVTSIAIGLASVIWYDPELGLRLARLATIALSLTLSWQLVSLAREASDRVAAWLVGINVLATLVLAGMARAETQTLGLQWIEQSINTVSQGLFLVAVMRVVAGSTDSVTAVNVLAKSKSGQT